ncbi:MAG: hypothetical protein TEF_11905 [Rhizobiales bacterium NRL2]|nr:MAG: hypothetical protein TEF_11905 [Rhizobiales bacterium NRL2]
MPVEQAANVRPQDLTDRSVAELPQNVASKGALIVRDSPGAFAFLQLEFCEPFGNGTQAPGVMSPSSCCNGCLGGYAFTGMDLGPCRLRRLSRIGQAQLRISTERHGPLTAIRPEGAQLETFQAGGRHADAETVHQAVLLQVGFGTRPEALEGAVGQATL